MGHIGNPGFVIALFSLILGTPSVTPGTPLTFETIDAPGAVSGTGARGINDAGQIVGWFSDSVGVHGFLKDGDSFTVIDVPGAFSTVPTGINGHGQIVALGSGPAILTIFF
jgi:probable HAF family extracellular repeat protein